MALHGADWIDGFRRWIRSKSLNQKWLSVEESFMIRRRRRQFARPQISALESRQLLSSTAPAPFIDSNGNLNVVGSSGNDLASLSDSKKLGVASVKVSLNGTGYYFDKAAITGGTIFFFGLEGNDGCLDKVLNLRLRANGGDGNDSIVGSNGNDQLIGQGGNDLLAGNGGNDLLYGDWTESTSAADSIIPYQGKDTVSGGDGNDSIYGGALDDLIDAGNGDDQVWGGSGNDAIMCGAGTNSAHGGWGNDRMTGGSGGDYLYGEEGDDVLYGGAAFDFLEGGDGNDFLDVQADGGNVNGGKGIDSAGNQPVINGVSFQDIFQNGSGTCWFLSTIGSITTTSLTNHGLDVSKYISFQGNGVYNVKLYNPKTKKPVVESVTYEGPASTNQGDAQVTYLGDANSDTPACEGEFWATVFQRGLMKYFKVDYTSYAAVSKADFGNGPGVGISPTLAFKLLGLVPQEDASDSSVAFMDKLRGLINRNGILQPMIASSKSSPDPKIVGGHAYQVMAIDNDGNVLLRNPWGKDGGTGNDGSDDGLVVVTASQFAGSFASVTYLPIALT